MSDIRQCDGCGKTDDVDFRFAFTDRSSGWSATVDACSRACAIAVVTGEIGTAMACRDAVEDEDETT